MLNARQFEEIFDTYYQDILTLVSFYTSNSAQKRDWVQDIFLKIWELRHKIDPDHPGLKGYLLTLARNHVLYELRILSNAHHYLIQELASETLPANHSTTNQMLNYQDLDQAYHKALSKVPERSRDVFSLSRKDGMTYNEIAKNMNISPKTVEGHISKALRLLRRELREFQI